MQQDGMPQMKNRTIKSIGNLILLIGVSMILGHRIALENRILMTDIAGGIIVIGLIFKCVGSFRGAEKRVKPRKDTKS
jgi:hypothetical protein